MLRLSIGLAVGVGHVGAVVSAFARQCGGMLVHVISMRFDSECDSTHGMCAFHWPVDFDGVGVKEDGAMKEVLLEVFSISTAFIHPNFAGGCAFSPLQAVLPFPLPGFSSWLRR